MNQYGLALDIYTVAFFGHRYVDHLLEAGNKLERVLHRLLEEKEYVDFLVGRDGDFDQAASSTICRLKRNFRDDNSAHIWVLPYPTAEYLENQECYEAYYDEIEICEASSRAHFKAAFQTRNRYMVDRADLIICYIDHKSGGAYQTIRYAEKQGKEILNLAEDIEY